MYDLPRQKKATEAGMVLCVYRHKYKVAQKNWWLSGWPGAFIARQGYYISNPQRSKLLLSQSEWDYWYGGKATNIDLLNTNGDVAVKAGGQRNGGSYHKRFSNVAVWNTVMPTYDYSLQKWYELISR